MQDNRFYHNPRCRKSREGLQIVRDKGLEVQVIEYLKDPPTGKELKEILAGLAMQPLELIRTQEKVFKELGLKKTDQHSDAEWIKIMTDNPILIERPILVYKNKTALGRPPQALLKIIG